MKKDAFDPRATTTTFRELEVDELGSIAGGTLVYSEGIYYLDGAFVNAELGQQMQADLDRQAQADAANLGTPADPAQPMLGVSDGRGGGPSF